MSTLIHEFKCKSGILFKNVVYLSPIIVAWPLYVKTGRVTPDHTTPYTLVELCVQLMITYTGAGPTTFIERNLKYYLHCGSFTGGFRIWSRRASEIFFKIY